MNHQTLKFTPLLIAVALCISACSNEPKVSDQESPQSKNAPQSSQEDVIEFNTLSALDEKLAKVSADNIEAYAKAVAEVDTWLFDVTEEVKARDRIDVAIIELRSSISTKIEKLLDDAAKAKNGKISSQLLTQVNTLLLLYPAPSTDTQRNALGTITEKISQTAKKVEDLKRLRYNQWAINQIERFLKEYHQTLKVNKFSELKKLVNTDKEALIKTSGDYLSKIDTLYLEPVVMDLYSHAFEQSKQAIGEDEVALITLTRAISNPSVQRKSPADF